MSNLCTCFVTADLYEHTTTDNEPDFGELDAMVSFTGGVTSCECRVVNKVLLTAKYAKVWPTHAKSKR